MINTEIPRKIVTMIVALLTITYVPTLTEVSAGMSPYDLRAAAASRTSWRWSTSPPRS